MHELLLLKDILAITNTHLFQHTANESRWCRKQYHTYYREPSRIRAGNACCCVQELLSQYHIIIIVDHIVA